MGKFTSKRYGRARETLSNDEAIDQVAVSSTNDNGNRDAVTGNFEASKELDTKSEGSRRIIINGQVFNSMSAASMYMATL